VRFGSVVFFQGLTRRIREVRLIGAACGFGNFRRKSVPLRDVRDRDHEW